MRPAALLFLCACTSAGRLTLSSSTVEEPPDTDQPVDTSGGETADTEDSAPPPPEGEDGEAIPDASIPEPDSDVLFAEDHLIQVEVTLSTAAYNSLLAEPFSYVSGDVNIDGHVVSDVGIRTKGENSWLPIDRKASLKLDFNRYILDQELLGLKGITLNAMNNDYAQMHERVSYRMYREMGMAAPRAMHAQLSINGEPYGLYTILDSVDKTMLGRFYEDPNGTMFEQHDVEFADAYIPCPAEESDTPPLTGDYQCFQLEVGDETKTQTELRAPLQAIADALEITDPNERYLAVGETLNWESFILYWAVGSVVAQFDAYPYRYAGDDCHVFVDPIDGLVDYVPHGADETHYYPDYDVRGDPSNRGLLASACMAVAECKDRYYERIWEVQDRSEELDMFSYALEVQAQIDDAARDDDHREWDMSYVTYYQQVMLDLIENRRAKLQTFIGPP